MDHLLDGLMGGAGMNFVSKMTERVHRVLWRWGEGSQPDIQDQNLFERGTVSGLES